ncbi:MAG: alpha-ribazole phosphatase [Gammaproteobacteria bacterium]|nr:alpha-ribazole phosphatase [Gammaproteobacteria bacterium]
MSGEFVQIDLLRHGEAEGGACYRGRTDDPLTVTGWQQMWGAVDGVVPWQGIVSSPLSRCTSFASALAERRTVPLQIDERLREMDFGDWEGRTAAELMATAPDDLTRFWQNPLHCSPPRGESLLSLRKRVLAAWNEIVDRQRPVLIVTHGGPIRVILNHVLGTPPERLMEINVPHAAMFSLRVSKNHVQMEMAG